MWGETAQVALSQEVEEENQTSGKSRQEGPGGLLAAKRSGEAVVLLGLGQVWVCTDPVETSVLVVMGAM